MSSDRSLWVSTPIGWIMFEDQATVETTGSDLTKAILHVVRRGETVAEFKPEGWFGFVYVDRSADDDKDGKVRLGPKAVVQ